MTLKDLVKKSRARKREVEEGLALMVDMGMLTYQEGCWHLPHFLERQYESDVTAIRMTKHRRSDVDVTANGTNDVTPPETENRDRVNNAASQLDLDFEKTWKQYPSKKEKQVAKKAYLALRKTDADPADIHDAVIAYANSRSGQDSQFTLHGSTFFAKERWRDWLPGGPAVLEANDEIEYYDGFGKPVYK